MNPPVKPQKMMPPMPPDSWFKRTETICGKFRKPCNDVYRDEEVPFLDCWDGKQQVRRFATNGPWARNAPKPVPDVKGCLSVNFPVCSVWQKPGVYQRLPIQAPQYDICRKSDSLQCTPYESVTYPSGRGVKTGFSFLRFPELSLYANSSVCPCAVTTNKCSATRAAIRRSVCHEVSLCLRYNRVVI